MKFLKDIINVIKFTYLKNKLDLHIENSKDYGYYDLNGKIVFDNNAYGRVTVEKRSDGTYSVIYFYCTKNYIIFRYNYCSELHSNSNERYRVMKKVGSLTYNSLSDDHLKDIIQRLYNRKESYNLYPIFRKHVWLQNIINKALDYINKYSLYYIVILFILLVGIFLGKKL